MKRFLDLAASDFKSISKKDLLDSIVASEGRVLMSEIIPHLNPTLYQISDAELAAAMGADIILLNMLDVNKPLIKGIPIEQGPEAVEELKRLVGRPLGINLEPVSESIGLELPELKFNKGRKATTANAIKARDLGIKFILITGNPGIGVGNVQIAKALKEISAVVGDDIVLCAGKMHAACILSEAGDNIISKNDIEEFVKSGADVILIPAPGTVPGITLDIAKELIAYAHKLGVATLTSIGTSQEGADPETIREIALMCKMAGTDIHHIGDSGYLGMALPENIKTYSTAIRGIRHTYLRMARSINR